MRSRGFASSRIGDGARVVARSDTQGRVACWYRNRWTAAYSCKLARVTDPSLWELVTVTFELPTSASVTQVLSRCVRLTPAACGHNMPLSRGGAVGAPAASAANRRPGASSRYQKDLKRN
jgi:hypothetical protein